MSMRGKSKWLRVGIPQPFCCSNIQRAENLIPGQQARERRNGAGGLCGGENSGTGGGAEILEFVFFCLLFRVGDLGGIAIAVLPEGRYALRVPGGEGVAQLAHGVNRAVVVAGEDGDQKWLPGVDNTRHGDVEGAVLGLVAVLLRYVAVELTALKILVRLGEQHVPYLLFKYIGVLV